MVVKNWFPTSFNEPPRTVQFYFWKVATFPVLMLLPEPLMLPTIAMMEVHAGTIKVVEHVIQTH